MNLACMRKIEKERLLAVLFYVKFQLQSALPVLDEVGSGITHI